MGPALPKSSPAGAPAPPTLCPASLHPPGRPDALADWSPGWHLLQFHRILQYARPRQGRPQPFFWMFVDNLLLSEDDRSVATRFLEVRAGTVSGCWPGQASPGTLGLFQGAATHLPTPEASEFSLQGP